MIAAHLDSLNVDLDLNSCHEIGTDLNSCHEIGTDLSKNYKLKIYFFEIVYSK